MAGRFGMSLGNNETTKKLVGSLSKKGYYNKPILPSKRRSRLYRLSQRCIPSLSRPGKIVRSGKKVFQFHFIPELYIYMLLITSKETGKTIIHLRSFRRHCAFPYILLKHKHQIIHPSIHPHIPAQHLNHATSIHPSIHLHLYYGSCCSSFGEEHSFPAERDESDCIGYPSVRPGGCFLSRRIF